MFKHSPSGKGMVYSPNGKGTMASIEYSLVIYSPNGKGMILWNIVFPSGNLHGKEGKNVISMHIKDAISVKISFMH